MATDAKRKKFVSLEKERINHYQHQHRGLNFLKLFLPPSTDRRVNIIGRDNHIYKGKIPTYPLDQLPPEVDPKSINEEELYKEIRDMRFPKVPPLQPLGPARRIGGEYTKAKRLTFAPAQVNLDDDKTEASILGADGKIYKAKVDAAQIQELDQKLRGTNRPVKTRATYGSSRGSVKPTVVSLYVDGKPISDRQPPIPLIQLPYVDLNKLIEWMEINSPEQKKEAPEPTEEQPEEQEDSKPAEETEGEPSKESTSTESHQTGSETSTTSATEVSDTSSISITEGSSELTDIVSEGEDTEASEAEPEVEKLEVSEPEIPESEAEPEVEKLEVSESEPEEET